jgi:hypothetical protein
MAESPVMIYCHKCGNWSGPSTTSHGLKFKCSHCHYPIKVNRYPDTNRWTVGANTRAPDALDSPAHSEPPTLTEVAARQAPALPPRVPIPGRVIEDNPHTAIAGLGRQVATDIARSYQRKQIPRREPGPFDAHTPGNVTYCEECQEGNFRGFKPKPGDTFGIGDYEVRLANTVTKRLCRDHMQAHEMGFCVPRSISSRRIYHRPPPSPGYRASQ